MVELTLAIDERQSAIVKPAPVYGPILAVISRPLFAILAQGLVTLLFIGLAVQNADVAVRHWWTVYSTLVDVGCIALLVFLVRREGLRLWDLVGFDKKKLWRDALLGVGLFIIIFPVSIFGGGMLASLTAYGTLSPEFPEAGFLRTLPLWAVLYSRLLWWPVWSVTEELVFQGYALPRLQKLTRSTWLSVAIVAIFWAGQHSFLPWINPQHGMYLFITFLPLTIMMQVAYLRIRRLPPLIVCHWLMDLASVLFLVQAI